MTGPQERLDLDAPEEPDRAEPPTPAILTVGDLNRRVRDLLADRVGEVWVEGELSGLRTYDRGGRKTVYGTLKDAEAEVSVVMWPEVVAGLRFEIEDGLKVQLLAEVGLYVQRGQYQLKILQARPAGIGELELAFQQLKEKLDKEGLFDEKRKRPLPRFPFRVGVVTSLQGAALRDFLNVTRRRNPALRVLVTDARVQGEGAAPQIVAGLEALDRIDDIDVIVLTRGGGSLEDLWPFNEEAVGRAIARARHPVLSAVGHETDWTISDMVADLRMPTPSAAAERVAWLRDELRQSLDETSIRLTARMRRRVAELRERVGWFDRAHGFRRMALVLESSSHRVGEAKRRLPVGLRHRIDLASTRLAGAGDRNRAAARRALDGRGRDLDELTRTMQALGPTRVLQRGYAIVRRSDGGPVVRSAVELEPEERLEVYLREGKAEVRVESTGPGLEGLSPVDSEASSEEDR